jgi:hypothetical protein
MATPFFGSSKLLGPKDFLRNNYDGTYTLIKENSAQTLVQSFIKEGLTYVSPIDSSDAAQKGRIPYGLTGNKRTQHILSETGFKDKAVAGGLRRYTEGGKEGVYGNRSSVSETDPL